MAPLIFVVVVLVFITWHFLMNVSKKRIQDFPREYPEDRDKERLIILRNVFTSPVQGMGVVCAATAGSPRS